MLIEIPVSLKYMYIGFFQAFMERLGLWGVGAQFRSFEQFIEFVQKKGLGMAEMLAMEMKMSGMYVSRGLSYKQAEVQI